MFHLKNPKRAAMSAFFLAFMALFPASAPAKMSVGTNLAGVSYFSTETAFADMMKMASPWFTSPVNNSTWDSGQESSIPVDSAGYPTAVPFNDSNGTAAYVHTIMPAPADGVYTLAADGSGQVRVEAPGLAKTTYNLNYNAVTFTVSGSHNTGGTYIYLDIFTSSSNDHLRNIRVWRPGYGDGKRTFYDTFKNNLAPFSTLRFMDWGQTNSSNVREDADRTKVDHFTQAAVNGVAVEYMVQLCNETGKDMWLCVPHQATDNYCWSVAYVVRQSLNPARKLYIEYTNEHWNFAGGFNQHTWIDNNIPDPTGTGYLSRKYGYRAAQVLNIFRQSFQGAGRGGSVVRVISGQATNSWIGQQALIGANNQCDALAIAPYFGGGVTQAELNQYGIPSNNTLLTNDTFSHFSDVQSALRANLQVAQAASLPLVCYEGGQHYVGSYDGGDTVDNTNLTARLTDFNRSWDMGNEYRWGFNGTPGYLDTLNRGGVSLFMHYNDVGGYGPSGSWGAREYIDQGVNSTPKAYALQDWIYNAN